MKKEKNFLDELVKVLYIGLILFICLIFMLILFSIKGHCASEYYYFPMQQNENGSFSDGNLTAIGNQFNSADNYVFVFTYSFAYGQYYCYALYFPKTSQSLVYGEINNDANSFSIYPINTQTMSLMKFSIVPSSSAITLYPTAGTNTGNYANLPSSQYNSNYNYVSNFQIMTSSSESANVVLFYDDGSIPDGDTARDDMEKPDIDDYIPSWNNKPSFDGSSVENALSSIWDITVWTAENTRDTIKGVGQFIGDTLRWTSQKIIDSIRSKIDEIKTGIINAINSVSAFVQDIKGLVTGIGTAIEYIKEPLDTTSVQATITNSTAFGDVSTITCAFTDFKGVFDSTSEPSEYKIPIHLENIPILNQTQAQYFDLSVISNQRGLIRAFCWVVTTFSLFVTVVDALPNYLKGGDE